MAVAGLRPSRDDAAAADSAGAPSRERRATICLSMIVRNEAHVVARALASVRELVDYWVICDTGSTDDTPAAVLAAMAGVPGELHRTEWLNFGHNRTEALQLARGKADYRLVIDADMVANVREDFRTGLHADAYEIRYEGPIDYTQRMLLADGHDWRFCGPTHEYVDAPTASTRALLPELTLTHFGDGGMRSDKLERDVRLLTAALEDAPENSRYAFYLAQSYRDLGRLEEALAWYLRRAADADGWDEERWYAMYEIGRLRQALGQPWPAVLEAYLRAYNARPTRIEPVYEIVRHYREAGEFGVGELFAARHLPEPSYPDDRLFIDREVYHYGFLLEAALCLVACGRASEAIAAFNRVIDCEDAPDWVAETAIRGRRAAVDMALPARRAVSGAPNEIVVVIPFHNPGHLFDDCLASLLGQQPGHVRMVFVDDASTDGADERVPLDDARVTLLRNESRCGAAYSVDRAVAACCDPEAIVVVLPGTDRLACPDALSHVDRIYREHDCDLVYGQSQRASGRYGRSMPAPDAQAFASPGAADRVSHLVTYRAALRRDAGPRDAPWPASAVAPQVVQPLLARAGFDRVRYTERVLHIEHDEAPPAPRPRASVGARQPRLSCMLFTRDDLPAFKHSLRSYCEQRYDARELVIATDGSARHQEAVERAAHALARGDVRVLRFAPGALAAAGAVSSVIDTTAAEILCDWPARERSAPDRLDVQLAELLAAGADACVLADRLQFFAGSRELFWVRLEQEQGAPAPPTAGLMAYRHACVPAPPRGEAGESVVEAAAGAVVARLHHAGPRAVRVVDDGAVDEPRWRRHSAAHAFDATFVHSRLGAIEAVLDVHRLARPLMIAARDEAPRTMTPTATGT